MPETSERLIEQKILTDIMIARGLKVIMDSDLANLYGVETRRLNEQVKRNQSKFPDDFMFQLSKEEFLILKSQIATSSSLLLKKVEPYIRQTLSLNFTIESAYRT